LIYFPRTTLAFLLLVSSLYAKEFTDLDFNNQIILYAGDVPFFSPYYKKVIGLSLNKSDENHIQFDITNSFPLPEASIDIFQAEDVFEHIEYSALVNVINEIYRILKKNGRLRISVPDYRCDILYNRSLKDPLGNILFDPGGGGDYICGKVVNGGHLWFPTIELIENLLSQTIFQEQGEIIFYHYYKTDSSPVMDSIDYSYGYIQRTPDHSKRVKKPRRPMSIVVDCIKTN
jgi:SAM-dependent methyltransferase